MKTYLDVVNETVEYYKTNPFGFDHSNDRCTYFGPHGEMFAVGRCLNDPQSIGGDVYNGDFVIKKKLGGGLKPEYSHLSNAEFWQKLQYYHDSIASGITPKSAKLLEEVSEYAENLDN